MCVRVVLGLTGSEVFKDYDASRVWVCAKIQRLEVLVLEEKIRISISLYV